MPKFDPKAEQTAFQLLDGDYPFEIVAVDNAISKGAKTKGSDVREVKLKFYTDTTFTKPMAQWTEDFIDAENCVWKWSVFAKCVGIVLTEGQDFDITEQWLGLRGWATCKPEASTSTAATDKERKYNRVAVFITNKGKLERAPVQAPKDEDDIPF